MSGVYCHSYQEVELVGLAGSTIPLRRETNQNRDQDRCKFLKLRTLENHSRCE